MNNEMFKNWSHVAEAVSGVAVVVTLVFLLVMVSGCDIRAAVAQESPYAGQQHRPIKSLSEKEVNALRDGAGMGFAKMAELNSYPGPKHVLAVADELELSDALIARTQSIYDEMHGRAVALGEELIAAEQALDRRFADASIDEASLHEALSDIGRIRADLRYVHLEAHLKQRRLLSDDQVARYDELRGYHH